MGREGRGGGKDLSTVAFCECLAERATASTVSPNPPGLAFIPFVLKGKEGVFERQSRSAEYHTPGVSGLHHDGAPRPK